MYTNDGVLQVISARSAGQNLVQAKAILDAVMDDGLIISEANFQALTRLEEDIKAHFVRRAELLGMTNVDMKTLDNL